MSKDINDIIESELELDKDIVVIPNYVDDVLINENIKTDQKKQIWKKKDLSNCSNCGKFGHSHKKCYEPITSYGIICLNLNNIDLVNSKKNIHEFYISKYRFPYDVQMLKNICINKYIKKNVSCNNRKDLDIYETKVSESIEYLIVRRRLTYNYIYLIRGLYDLEIENIIKSINLLTKDEYNKLITYDFDMLWKDIWEINDNSSISISKTYKSGFLHEYKHAKEQFIFFHKYILPQIKHKINIQFTFPEWGFPKGKRNNSESNIECAIREFEEETGLTSSDYILLDRLFPLIENIKGSNGINYKHVYYIAILNSDYDLSRISSNNNSYQKFEIGDIGLFNIDETIRKMRIYDIEKIEIINKLKLFNVYNTRYFDKFYQEIIYY